MAVRFAGAVFAAHVLHTPGHTPGSISLMVEETGREAAPPSAKETPGATRAPARLMAGDTLFRGSIGRTDLWGGSHTQILDSIREKLLVLPEETPVYPGHGEITTIGFERAHNPFFS